MIGKGYTVKSAILEMDMVAEVHRIWEFMRSTKSLMSTFPLLRRSTGFYEKMAPSIEMRL